ncbi:MAG: ATP-dependent dethiobiotin synthetase BioD [Planctomycetota bacterium]|nr:MAG: ATP-dependent dethiobiotin synthetase BioD [Planctomycetota bacterium]
MSQILLVSGTDTGVGKTYVACALVEGLVMRGREVGVCKPVESGVDGGPHPNTFPVGSDAELLAAAAGGAQPVEQVLPWALSLPAAPSAAARVEAQAIDTQALVAHVRELAAQHDVLVVEGAGGLLVPIAPGFNYLDLARELGAQLLLVARTGLGTLNHTALSVAAARAADVPVIGVVLNAVDGPVSPSDRENLAELPALVDAPILAELPHAEPPEPAESWIDEVLEALLG